MVASIDTPGIPYQLCKGLTNNGSVIIAGSFDKLLFPSLRLGYAAVPSSLLDKFVAARFTLYHRSSLRHDRPAILLDFIAEGHFARHIRRMRELYSSRMEYCASLFEGD